MVDVIIQFKDENTLANKLSAIGILERKDDEGNVIAGQFRYPNATPFYTKSATEKYITMRLTPEQIDRFPPNDNPNFAVVWDSRETDGEGNQLPRPTYPVDVQDENGTVIGTREQEIGGLV